MPGRSGEVRVSSGVVEGGVEIRVVDNGVGMSAEQREHAFEPFYTTRQIGAGAGLGLSTARNIVLAHSGRIELCSTPGPARPSLSFSRSPHDRLQRSFTGQTTAPQAPASHLTAPKYRLLLVDDEPGIVKALARVFRQENYEVVTAGNGNEGLARLAEGPFQLVISDFMMPGMDGAHFLREVKQRSPDTIRIMLTGHANTDAVMGAINDGAVYKFILKPWNDDDLRVTVALALEQFDLMARNRQLKSENAQKAKEISALSRLAATHRSRLGIMLHKKHLLTDSQLQELTLLQERRKEPLIRLAP